MGLFAANLMAKIVGATPQPAKPQRTKPKGEFDWRIEDPHAFRRRNVVPIEAFVRHWWALGLHEGITRAEVISLYVEWLEANDARPIDGWRRWDIALRACGVTKLRSSLPGRPRLYYAPAAIAAPARNAVAGNGQERGRVAA